MEGSELAIEFMRKCLNKDKEARPSAKQLFDEDEWLGTVNMQLNRQDSYNILRNIELNVDKEKYFQYAITSFISNVLIKSHDARQIGKLFMELDTERKGKLTRQQFVESDLVRECFNARDEEINEIFNRIDTDENGTIEYSEFITATMDRSVQLSQ